MTAGLREAMDDVRRSVAVLAAESAAHTPPASGHRSDTAAGRRTATRSSASAAHRHTGSWTSPTPWPRSTKRSPPEPRCLARETPAPPPQPHSTTACPSAP
jgi:hypothetical protein